MCWSPEDPSSPKCWSGWRAGGGRELGQSPSGDHTMMDASLSFILCQLVPDGWGCTRGQSAGQYQVPSSPHPAAIKETFHAQSPCNLLSFTLLCSGMGCQGEPPGRGCRSDHVASSPFFLPREGSLGRMAAFPHHSLCRGLLCGSGESVSSRGGTFSAVCLAWEQVPKCCVTLSQAFTYRSQQVLFCQVRSAAGTASQRQVSEGRRPQSLFCYH